MSKETIDLAIKTRLSDVMSMFLKLFPAGLKIKENVYVAGGAIVNLRTDTTVADYDFFIKSDEARDYIVTLLGDYFDTHAPDDRACELRAHTQNGYTLNFDGTIIQLVTRFTGPPERVFKSFDFEHCKAFYDYATGELVYNEELIMSKKLVYTGEDNYPLNTMKRLVKFIRRGYDIDNESVLALAKKLSAMDLEDETVLKEQLIGFYGSSLR